MASTILNLIPLGNLSPSPFCSPKSFGSEWENSVEGLYLLTPPPQDSGPGRGLQDLGGGSGGGGCLSPAHPPLLLFSPPRRRIAKTAPGANGAPQEIGARISESQRYPSPLLIHPTPTHPHPHLSSGAFFQRSPTPGQGSRGCAPGTSHRTLLFRGFPLGRRPNGWGRNGEWGNRAGGGGCASQLSLNQFAQIIFRIK